MPLSNHAENQATNVHALPGVDCSVANCRYHNGAKNCVAPKIHVGAQSASDADYAAASNETDCATFTEKR